MLWLHNPSTMCYLYPCDGYGLDAQSLKIWLTCRVIPHESRLKWSIEKKAQQRKDNSEHKHGGHPCGQQQRGISFLPLSLGPLQPATCLLDTNPYGLFQLCDQGGNLDLKQFIKMLLQSHVRSQTTRLLIPFLLLSILAEMYSSQTTKYFTKSKIFIYLH